MKIISNTYLEYLRIEAKKKSSSPQFKKMVNHTIEINKVSFDCKIRRYRKSIYIIVDDIIHLIINSNDALGGVTIQENGKLWYSYNTENAYTGLESISIRNKFISDVKNLML